MHQTDSIGHFVDQWREQRPDLDASPFAIFGRMQRLSSQVQRAAANEWLKRLGLSWESFSLLAALRRSGPAGSLRPKVFYRESLLTSGAITNRINRVEKKGWIRRFPDPSDRRGVIIKLTPSGRALADKAIEIHFKCLAQEFSDLTAAERSALIALLTKLLTGFESRNR